MRYEFSKSLELARALYDENYILRCQHFSFAFLKSRLIGVGRNQNRTHPLNLRNPKYKDGKKIEGKLMCSELSLFLSLRNKTNYPFNKISIFNVRIDRNGEVKLSCPCNSCRSLLSFLSPKSVFYTTNTGSFEKYC